MDLVPGRGRTDDPVVAVERSVGLSRYYELVGVIQLSESLQEDVQAFVGTDESEEQEGFQIRPETQLFPGLFLLQRLAEVAV